ncbi:hypothetical protein MVEN_01826800 [Mycena venus]|uniref:Uncharacterized protein n=1 Tax=Mycena venus TaxID=2733690 RepID=A0A8H6XL42_9AGAR|nr:hypothetical protein MVEN_01826800 [Mycena venus]
MAVPADQALILLEGLYALVESQSVVAAAALLMHGILLLLFVLALFFLLRHHAEGQSIRVLLFTAILLAGFAIFQVVLDVALVALPNTVLQICMKEGMSQRAMSLLETFATIYNVRQGALATNNAIADSLLLYRCYLIWATSRYSRLVVAIPLLLILATAAIAYAAIYLVLDIRIPFGFALLTNVVLLGLTGGRIWYKRRQAAVLLGAAVVHRRYTATLEIIFESGLIYVAAVLIYLVSISNSVPPFTTFQNICWGSLAQLVNIVPMMIVVRVALSKTATPSDTAASSMHKEFV